VAIGVRRTISTRAWTELAVLLGLGLLPVLPAGVPVLAAALAAPAVLYLRGRRGSGGRDDVRGGDR
ncbi:hypothetical protein AB0K74_35975, partial [Streptomyces sp. NPDC056159]